MFIKDDLAHGVIVCPDKGQSNYLLNVLRLKTEDKIILFNGRDGEWMAKLIKTGKKACSMELAEKLREQPPALTLEYWFAPLKQARQDYMVQKAVEMGAGMLRPIFTDHTQIQKINSDRVLANCVEAAEQCGILNIPELSSPQKLEKALGSLDEERMLIFCDELEESARSIEELMKLKGKKLAVLIGPEGGFSERERVMIKAHPRVVAISLGPRILRADTAAVAALALVQALSDDLYS